MLGYMIGGIFGIGLGWFYIQSSLQGLSEGEKLFGASFRHGIFLLLILAALGVVLFPRTIGMMLTPAAFLTPVALIIGIAKNGFGYGLSQTIFGLICWLITLVIARIRPNAT